jgi:hypothetical protein
MPQKPDNFGESRINLCRDPIAKLGSTESYCGAIVRAAQALAALYRACVPQNGPA